VTRSPGLVVALAAAVGGALIYLVALPALWRLSWLDGVAFAGLGAAQVVTIGAALIRPTRRRVLLAAAAALAVVALWAVVRLAAVVPAPDSWAPVSAVIGFTDRVCAGLEAVAAIGLAWAAARAPRSHRSLPRRLLAAVALAPLAALVLLGSVVGVAGSSDGLVGAGLPAGAVAPRDLAPGRLSTVEYCRPDGVPLAMDLYLPSGAGRGRAAPVALYVHGGAIWGDRQRTGLGALLANHDGALFGPLQERLNARGFVVAAIDFRLPPAARWPAPIADAKCAVRFLRAHAADLGIDPARIGAWGSSGGGHLASLLGLAGPGAGFDRGQYPEQSSAVQAVVDMFGASDLTDVEDASPFVRSILQLYVGGSPAVRRAASPITYAAPGAPPFLILQGAEDANIRPRQSAGLAQRLRSAGVPAILIEVEGTGHTLATPSERPSPDELAATVSDFFLATLR
jgi:acetyl esterase/lipase